MAQRRKSLSEKDIRTILAVFESLQEHCHYRWSELNTILGSMTIDEMQALQLKLRMWYKGYTEDEEEWS